MQKVLLAYSGGLDTTYCLVYLQKELGMEVHAVTVDTGGFSAADKENLKKRATELGAASYRLMDARHTYYEQYLRYLVYGNVLKNSTYPLSVSAERMVQAITIAKAAQEIGATAIAHGSTGAGNDQVRFDMAFQTLVPGARIITPIRDQRLSREAEIAYLKANGVDMNFEKAQYSINQGLWGTSVGGRETLTSRHALPESAWPTPVSKHEPESVSLTFVQGELTAVNDQPYAHPVAAIEALRDIAQPFGIGRDIHVGDTIIGIKGRVGFEAAAPLLILKAHHLLEKHTLTKWQLYWKDQLAQWYGNWLHEGQWLEPVMRDLEQMMTSAQRTVTGKVFLTLHPYRFTLEGIESPHDLMSAKFGAYGEMNQGWTGDDVRGFAKIFGNQNTIWYAVNDDRQP
jgi:argininosuccinate synthase